MDKISGIGASTAGRILLDAGCLYVDYGLGTQALIGATKGGSTFDPQDEYRDIEVDGAPGPVKGFVRRLKCSPVIKTTLLEISTTNLLRMYPGMVNNPNSTHDVLTRTAQVASTNYLTNVAYVTKKQGTAQLFIIKLSNVLCKFSSPIGGTDNDEISVPVEFHAHYAVGSLTAAEPFEISNPLEGATGFYTLSYTAGANGQIVGLTSQVVQDGDDGQIVIARADTGYNFSAWSDGYTPTDGLAADERQDLNVAANHTVTATFVAG